MKAFLQLYMAWSLIVCLATTNLVPFIFPDKNVSWDSAVVIDSHNDSLPADCKEENFKSLKVARNVLSLPFSGINGPAQQLIENQRWAVTQTFLPVILPPPKATA